LPGSQLAQLGRTIWFDLVAFAIAVGVAEWALPAIRVPDGRAFGALRGHSILTAALQGAVVGGTVGLFGYAVVGGEFVSGALPFLPLSGAAGFASTEGLLIGVFGRAGLASQDRAADIEGKSEPRLAFVWKRGYLQTFIASATGLFIVLASTGSFETDNEYFGRAAISWILGAAIAAFALRVTECSGPASTAIAMALLTPLVFYGMYRPWALVVATLLLPLVVRAVVLWLIDRRSSAAAK